MPVLTKSAKLKDAKSAKSFSHPGNLATWHPSYSFHYFKDQTNDDAKSAKLPRSPRVRVRARDGGA